ncbi:MAG: T9SS type A sorting domain-containing protein [Bacteroidales bacterium]|nr:T9SS type A sorting domain-containing protein [Bacteroidales bacterium]MDD6165608.1 T9SS type A sorting domain-containing protein [Bacteroidales bacterium]MDD6614060.1 T9SS type A sorting domain-containing protein [Bacteroidales bacterium]
MKRLSIFALALVLVSVVSAFGQEENRTLASKNSGSWAANNGSIWGTKGKPFYPTSNDDVTIIAPHIIDIVGGETAKARNLTIQEGGTLNNNNGQSLEVTYDITIAGTLNNSGTITAREGGLTIDNGTLDNQTNGTINADVSISGGTLTNSGKINGGLTVSGGTVYLNQGSTTAAPIRITGGTVNIAAGAVVNFTNATMSGTYTLNIAEGAVVIGYQGEQSISISLTANKWNFIGFPHVENISPLAANGAPSIWALAFDYGTNQWAENYLHWIDGGQQDALPCGQGIFAWPANDYTITASSVVTNENRRMTYSSTAGSNEKGRWFALANPFSFPLDITKFLNANSGIIQGGCVYKYNGSTFDENVTSGTIKVGQGFFVNMASNDGQIQFNNDQYSTSTAKSKSAEREFVRVSVSTEGYKVPVMFAQNDDASDGYDIFDANKMFGDGSVAEPYLICNGINLCKEEVSSTNYTATMNIKSSESRSVEIVADNIPEGYSLTLLDGAIEMEMREGGVYTTDIAEGENADRFKLLITKNNVSIADVAEAESIRVVNNNRTISIYGGNDVRTEVYNALGQKVYETSDRAFDLNNVASGAYVLRVQDGKSVNSTKIVVE